MGAFSKLNRQDAFVQVYTAHKSFSVTSGSLDDYNITIYDAVFDPTFSIELGVTSSGEYSHLVHKSIDHLYYQHLSGSTVVTGSYDIYPFTTQHSYQREILSSSINVISIPSELFGSHIRPDTFRLTSGSDLIYDGGDGKLYATTEASGGPYSASQFNSAFLTDQGTGSATTVIGDIIYEHGIAIVNDSNHIPITNFTCSFQNTYHIYEHNYYCRIRQNEFNYSYNPSLSTDNSGSVKDFATSSNFAPYVTSVGLYNDRNELMAIGKIGQPIPTSATTDMTFVIKFDM